MQGVARTQGSGTGSSLPGALSPHCGSKVGIIPGAEEESGCREG